VIDSCIGFAGIYLMSGLQWADGKEKMRVLSADICIRAMLKQDKPCDNFLFYAIKSMK